MHFDLDDCLDSDDCLDAFRFASISLSSRPKVDAQMIPMNHPMHRWSPPITIAFGCQIFCWLTEFELSSRRLIASAERPWKWTTRVFSRLFVMRRLVCLSFRFPAKAASMLNFRKLWISRWNARSTNLSTSLSLGVLLLQTRCGPAEHRQVLQGAESRGERTCPEADRLPDHERWQPGAQRREGAGDPELGQRFEWWVIENFAGIGSSRADSCWSFLELAIWELVLLELALNDAVQTDCHLSISILTFESPESLTSSLSPTPAFESALTLEKKVNESLLQLHAISSNHNDPQVSFGLRYDCLDSKLWNFRDIRDIRSNCIIGNPSTYLVDWPISESDFNSPIHFRSRIPILQFTSQLSNKFTNCPLSLPPQCCDFIETHYLEEQVKSIKEIADYVAQLKRVGNDLGVYIFDREFKS